MGRAVKVVFTIISLLVTLYFLSNTMHSYDNFKVAEKDCFETRDNYIAEYGELPEQYKNMCQGGPLGAIAK